MGEQATIRCLGCGVMTVRGTGYRYSRCGPCAKRKHKEWRDRNTQTRICPLIPDARLCGAPQRFDVIDAVAVDAPGLMGSNRCCHCLSAVIPADSRSVNYCSNSCSQRASNAGRRPVRGCVYCGEPLPYGSSRYCSDHRGYNAAIIDCIVCGATFQRTHGGLCCSTECSEEAKRERYRRKNRARRTKSRPGVYTLREIGDRAGWRCHLCGKKVRGDLSGMHPRGPTIDHLVPLSKGGTDSARNVDLAHRSCNVSRGNTDVEFQMRLIA
jgi:hypothetical protein